MTPKVGPTVNPGFTNDALEKKAADPVNLLVSASVNGTPDRKPISKLTGRCAAPSIAPARNEIRPTIAISCLEFIESLRSLVIWHLLWTRSPGTKTQSEIQVASSF